eukprot:1652759-Pleurochrysis_carterae.AAC.4
MSFWPLATTHAFARACNKVGRQLRVTLRGIKRLSPQRGPSRSPCMYAWRCPLYISFPTFAPRRSATFVRTLFHAPCSASPVSA